MSAGLLAAAFAALVLAMPARDGFRDRFLRALVFFGAALFIVTESLSVFSLIRPVPLIACWVGVLSLALLWIVRTRGTLRVTRESFQVEPVLLISLAGIVTILGLTAVTAAFSPPNSADAMAYHLPRVVYWAEQGSIRFFPTQYFNQIMLQPLAEYFMVHTYVLTGGDHLVNFIQWFASSASIIGVSSVARTFGAGVRGQAIAALFCASLPSGILASSGAKNDYLLAMWLVAAVYFARRFTATQETGDALLLGAALGLALLTKATAYLFAPWVLAAIFAARANGVTARMAVRSIAALVCALAMNTPHYVRDYQLSGSVLGFDSAQGNGFFRWRNDTFGWKQTVSNILRNTSEQLGARSNGWNQSVYSVVLGVHQRLGIDINDPATTWRWTTFAAPENANHEANAPNRWHLAALLVATFILVWQGFRGEDRERALYALSLACAFIGFCAYLKWQPFLSRLFLPLFVLGAPLTSVLGEIGTAGALRIVRLLVQIALCLFLLDNAKHPALDNWVRPLRGPRSVLHTPRAEQYFADMSQWNNAGTYRKAVDILAHMNCETTGIDITNLPLEYPLQALLRERKPGTVFIHTGVQNVSERYRQPVDAPACTVVCLDCAGDATRMLLYRGFSNVALVDRFVIFRQE